MRKIIHHIRKQPEEVRRHILHFLTVVCAIVLVFFWIYSLGTNLNDIAENTKGKEDLQPLSALKGNIIGGYQSITGPNSNPEE